MVSEGCSSPGGWQAPRLSHGSAGGRQGTGGARAPGARADAWQERLLHSPGAAGGRSRCRRMAARQPGCSEPRPDGSAARSSVPKPHLRAGPGMQCKSCGLMSAEDVTAVNAELLPAAMGGCNAPVPWHRRAPGTMGGGSALPSSIPTPRAHGCSRTRSGTPFGSSTELWSLSSAWGLQTSISCTTPTRAASDAEKLLCCTLSHHRQPALTAESNTNCLPAPSGPSSSHIALPPSFFLCLSAAFWHCGQSTPSCASSLCLEGNVHQCSWEKRHFLLPCPFKAGDLLLQFVFSHSVFYDLNSPCRSLWQLFS